jgi:hypothetical protein
LVHIPVFLPHSFLRTNLVIIRASDMPSHGISTNFDI